MSLCYYRIDIQTVCGQPANDERHARYTVGRPTADAHPFTPQHPLKFQPSSYAHALLISPPDEDGEIEISIAESRPDGDRLIAFLPVSILRAWLGGES